MNDFPSEDETLDLYLLLGRTREAVRKLRSMICDKFNVTASQAAVIQIIYDIGGEARTKEISGWLGRKRHSIHTIIERMEKDNLVEKIVDPSRKNGVKIILTEKGKEIHCQTKGNDSLSRVMANLPKNDRAQLKSSLEILLAKAREEIGEEDTPMRPNLNT